MFKPKNTPSQEVTRSNRVRLDPIPTMPTLDVINVMVGEAQRVRGNLCELPIRRPNQHPNFVLTCQHDTTSADPVWTLYEGDDGSKVVWTYPNDNVEMILDIVAMSISDASSPMGKMPELKPNAAAQPAPTQAPSAPAASPPQQPTPSPSAPAPAGGAGAPSAPPGYPQGTPPYPAPGTPYPYPGQPYPAAGYPPYPGAPYPQAPYPGQPYPPGYPQQWPGQEWQQQGWAGQPGAPAPGPAPQPAQAAPQPAPQPAQPAYTPPMQSAPLTEPSGGMNKFIDLISKGPSNLLIGHLLVEAGVVPEPCVEAALRLQELVRDGKMSNADAIEALRKAAEQGGKLEDKVVESVKKPAQDPKEATRRVLLLLQEAGVLAPADVKMASEVRAKHGGDVVSILVSAGKLERKLLEAGQQCYDYMSEMRIRHDDAMRALKHCRQNNVGFTDALMELSISLL